MMNDNSVRELLYTINGFAKEGIITIFSNDAVDTFNRLCQEYSTMMVVSMIVESYTKLRDKHSFDRWFTINTNYGHLILCRLYRNRIFEVWAVIP